MIATGGTPNGIRTRVAAVKGRCPRPLDDGGHCSATGLASEDEENIRQKRAVKAKRMTVMTVTQGLFLEMVHVFVIVSYASIRRFSLIAHRLD